MQRYGLQGPGRLYEIMPMNDELRTVLQGVSSVELKREAIRLGMKTLRQSASLNWPRVQRRVSHHCSAAD